MELFSGYNPKLVDYEKFRRDCAKDFDFVVLSGGSIHISNPDELVEEKVFLKKTNKPVLGICLGLQLLGVAFGSKILELPNIRRGFFDFELFGKKGKIYFAHSWFLKDAPKEFEVLRKSGDIIEVMVHKKKPFLGLQAHPEMSGEYGVIIRDLFINRFVKRNEKNE
ncbi:MAG: gamma-glutamyl-gamma-aminobutyrate hydrolase family protein [Nanoarchaeota archaeon]|nr:gamma-glutamyl-gamma-aminobutyrate hydrolase family protein [Nanoarchaeota archaeon]MBU1030864.1 gamma-glutamyl-gamma-aminobutyrate hydrolase family protein [Nanoarchaeota archaeon]MBU1850726.1 gamma-glutamyl-gamma-aminobutyrate hydrolase family protein [Nanoarchaeota archaeon]